MAQGGLAVPVEWCLMMVSYGQGHHELDRLHGLAGGLKITRAGGDRLDPALLHRERNPIARLASNAFKRGGPAATLKSAHKRSRAASWGR